MGARRLPQRQHAVEAQAVDRLGNAGLLDLARDGTQADRIERDRSCRAHTFVDAAQSPGIRQEPGDRALTRRGHRHGEFGGSRCVARW